MGNTRRAQHEPESLIEASSATRSPECLSFVSKQYSALRFHGPPQDWEGHKEAARPPRLPGYAATHVPSVTWTRSKCVNLAETIVSRILAAPGGRRNVRSPVRRLPGFWVLAHRTSKYDYSFHLYLSRGIFAVYGTRFWFFADTRDDRRHHRRNRVRCPRCGHWRTGLVEDPLFTRHENAAARCPPCARCCCRSRCGGGCRRT